MRRRKRRSGESSEQAEMLERERFSIERQYLELDDAILHGQGSSRILGAAQTLAEGLLQHFTHEEQFRKQISFAAPEDPHVFWKKNTAELLQMQAGLRQGELYAALRLRSFCKSWLHIQTTWTSTFQPALGLDGETAQS